MRLISKYVGIFLALALTASAKVEIKPINEAKNAPSFIEKTWDTVKDNWFTVTASCVGAVLLAKKIARVVKPAEAPKDKPVEQAKDEGGESSSTSPQRLDGTGTPNSPIQPAEQEQPAQQQPPSASASHIEQQQIGGDEIPPVASADSLVSNAGSTPSSGIVAPPPANSGIGHEAAAQSGISGNTVSGIDN